MVSKLKNFLRYILRRILFADGCVVCNSIIKPQENALCIRCLEGLKSISSLKKYKNVYYLWILDENLLKILKASQNRRTFAEDIREIIVKKINFILANEKISSLIYKDSEFFISLFNKKTLENFSNFINKENNKKLIIKENLYHKVEDGNIYFSLFMSKKLTESTENVKINFN